MTDVALIDTLRLKENGSFTFRVEVKDIQGESGHEVPFPAKHMIGLPAAGRSRLSLLARSRTERIDSFKLRHRPHRRLLPGLRARAPALFPSGLIIGEG